MTTDTKEPTVETVEAGPKKFSRDDIRTAILNSPGEDELVEAFGVQIEVRTPCLEDLLQYRDAQEDDYAMARAIINNCYVPGTADERVFDDTDTEVLMKTKFSKDMKKLNQAVMRALGADDTLLKQIEDNTKSSEE